jgi:hypothetical protein
MGWVFTAIFTVGAGAASIWSVLPTHQEPSELSVPVSEKDNLRRAITMAKMEGAKFTVPSATEVVAKFYVRPTVSSPLDKKSSFFALVSVSPFKPASSDFIFDGGECRFLGYATDFDPSSNKAVLSIKTISCVDNSNQGYSLVYSDYDQKPSGVLTDLKAPTEGAVVMSKESDGTYSVPLLQNVLLKFSQPVDKLEKTGKSANRF